MATTTRLLGYLASALSMINLIFLAFKVGLHEALLLIVEYYERFTEVALGWIEPLAEPYLKPLAEFFQQDLHLHAHWRHIFVLMGVYFFRSAGAAYGAGNASIAVFRAIWGTAIALLASIGAGLVTLVDGYLSANFFIAAIPILGVMLFDLGNDAWSATWYRANYARLASRAIKSWWQEFGIQALYDFERAAVGLIIVVVGLQVPFVQKLPSPGLALLGVLLVVLSLYIIASSTRAARLSPEVLENHPSAFRSEGSANLGTAMLLSLVGAISFFALNAGLQHAGL